MSILKRLLGKDDGERVGGGGASGSGKTSSNKVKPVVLLVLDGWGVARPSGGNAIHLARTPNWDSYLRSYPNGELIASGESVGLPAGEEGNSEVGHLTMSAGRVVLQSLLRINTSIEDGSFYNNKAFLGAIDHARKHKSKLHVMGLVGSGEVHSSLKHFYAMVDLMAKSGIKEGRFHLFTDGRDAPPKEALGVVGKIEQALREKGVGKVASVSGRYFAMDRDFRWGRTRRAYEAIVMGKGLMATSAEEAVRQAYEAGKTDEFIEPTVIVDTATVSSSEQTGSKGGQVGGAPEGGVGDDEAVIFLNFRIDRPRQLAMAFTESEFEKIDKIEMGDDPEAHGKVKEEVEAEGMFERERLPRNMFFVTMTEYQEKIPVSAIAFPPEGVVNSLPEVVSKAGLKQFHLAESEKERMVSFYVDGLREEPFEGESVKIVESPKVETYDKKPEMNVLGIVEEFGKALAEDKYELVVVNFANPDMVAHSGNIKATIEACERVDKAMGELVVEVLQRQGKVLITADHGNAEEMLRFPSTSYFYTSSEGEVDTEHSSNPVPVVLLGQEYGGEPVKLTQGSLSDVGVTVLGMLGLEKPIEMVGRNLLEEVPVSSKAPVAKEEGEPQGVGAVVKGKEAQQEQNMPVQA